MKNCNYITTCSSTQAYKTKATSKDYAKATYHNVRLNTIDEFASLLCTNGLFSSILISDNNFHSYERVGSNILGTQVIFVDFDNEDNDYSIDSALSDAVFVPNIVYETNSSSESKQRWRFVYVLDSVVDCNSFYMNYVRYTSGYANHVDKSSANSTQLFQGTTNGVRIVNRTYYPACGNVASGENRISFKRNIERRIISNYSLRNKCLTDEKFGLKTLRGSGIRYSNFIPDENKLITAIPKDFAEIYFPVFKNKDGHIEHRKIKKGFHRLKRFKDYARCLCYINKNITLEMLYYEMAYLRRVLFDNHDGKINNAFLFKVCNIVYSERNDFFWNQRILQSRVPKHKVNKELARSMGYSNMLKAYWDGMRQLKEERIGELYDFNKSIVANWREINSIGVKVSKKSCEEFYKKNQGGINKRNTIYDKDEIIKIVKKLPNLPVTKIADALNDMGIGITRRWLAKLLKIN